MRGADRGSMLEHCLASGGIDALATALVADAYVGTGYPDAPLRAHSSPEREDENTETGHPGDPLDPRKGQPQKPSDPLPLEAPPVPKLRPLE